MTWTCSVSLRTKRTLAPGVPGAGSGAATGSSAVRSPSVRVASSTIASWSTDPAAAITTEPGT